MNLIERIFAINFFSSFVFPTLASKLNSVKRSSRSLVYTFDILILSFAKTDAKSARAPGLSSPVAFIKALSLNDLPFSIGSFLVKFFKDKTSMLLPTKILLNSSSLFLFWVAINN